MEQLILLTTNEVANMLNVTPDCVRKWHNNGTLRADYVSEGGHRKYSVETVRMFMSKTQETITNDARVEWEKSLLKEMDKYFEETPSVEKMCLYSPEMFGVYKKVKPVYMVGDGGCLSVSDTDSVKLSKDGFETNTRFKLCGHPNLVDGVYNTDIKTRYKYVKNLANKVNNNIPEWAEEDIDNVWGYLSWFYLYRKSNLRSMTAEEFIKVLLNNNFVFIFNNITSYGEYIEKFAEQVYNYSTYDYCRKYLYRDGMYEQTVKVLLSAKNYNKLQVRHKGVEYLFNGQSMSNAATVVISVFDDEKFKYIMDKYGKNLLGCKPIDFSGVCIDSLIGEDGIGIL